MSSSSSSSHQKSNSKKTLDLVQNLCKVIAELYSPTILAPIIKTQIIKSSSVDDKNDNNQSSDSQLINLWQKLYSLCLSECNLVPKNYENYLDKKFGHRNLMAEHEKIENVKSSLIKSLKKNKKSESTSSSTSSKKDIDGDDEKNDDDKSTMSNTSRTVSEDSTTTITLKIQSSVEKDKNTNRGSSPDEDDNNHERKRKEDEHEKETTISPTKSNNQTTNYTKENLHFPIGDLRMLLVFEALTPCLYHTFDWPLFDCGSGLVSSLAMSSSVSSLNSIQNEMILVGDEKKQRHHHHRNEQDRTNKNNNNVLVIDLLADAVHSQYSQIPDRNNIVLKLCVAILCCLEVRNDNNNNKNNSSGSGDHHHQKNYFASRSVRSIVTSIVSIAALEDISSTSSSSQNHSNNNNNNNNNNNQHGHHSRTLSTPASAASSSSPAAMMSFGSFDDVADDATATTEQSQNNSSSCSRIERDSRTVALVYVARRYFNGTSSNTNSNKNNHKHHFLLEDMIDSLCNCIEDSLDATNVETTRSNMTEERRKRKVAVSLAVLHKIFSSVFIVAAQQQDHHSISSSSNGLSLNLILDRIFAILYQTALSSSSQTVSDLSFKLFQSIVIFSCPTNQTNLDFIKATKISSSVAANIPIFTFRALFPLAKCRSAPLVQRERALNTLAELLSNPDLVIDLFWRFDCNENQHRNLVEEILQEVVGMYFSMFAHPEVMRTAENAETEHHHPRQHHSRTNSIRDDDLDSENNNTTTLKCALLSIFISCTSSIRVLMEKLISSNEKDERKTTTKNVHFRVSNSSTSGSSKKRILSRICDNFNNGKFDEAFDMLEGAKNEDFEKKNDHEENSTAPEKNIKYHPSVVASFLYKQNYFIHKLVLGDFLSKSKKPLNHAVLEEYVRQFNFRGLFVDEALRLFLSSFKICGEAQVVDMTMELFASHYIIQNPDSERNGGIKNASCAFVLAFSICMLNTDAHSPNVTTRMPFQVFLERVRLLEDSADVPEIFVRGIYDRVVSHEITLRLGPNDPKPDDEENDGSKNRNNERSKRGGSDHHNRTKSSSEGNEKELETSNDDLSATSGRRNSASLFSRAMMFPLELTGITRYVEARRKEEEFSKESKRYTVDALNEMKFVSRFMSSSSSSSAISILNSINSSPQEKLQLVLTLLNDVVASPLCYIMLPILEVATKNNSPSENIHNNINNNHDRAQSSSRNQQEHQRTSSSSSVRVASPPLSLIVSEVEFDLAVTATSLAFKCFTLFSKDSENINNTIHHEKYRNRIQHALLQSALLLSDNNNNSILDLLLYSSSSSHQVQQQPQTQEEIVKIVLARRLKISRVLLEATLETTTSSSSSTSELWSFVFEFISFLAKTDLLDATASSSSSDMKSTLINTDSGHQQQAQAQGRGGFFNSFKLANFFRSTRVSNNNANEETKNNNNASLLTTASKNGDEHSSSLSLLQYLLAPRSPSKSSSKRKANNNSTNPAGQLLSPEQKKLLKDLLQKHVFHDDVFEKLFTPATETKEETRSETDSRRRLLLQVQTQIESCIAVCSSIFKNDILHTSSVENRSHHHHRRTESVAGLLTLLPLLSDLLCQYSRVAVAVAAGGASSDKDAKNNNNNNDWKSLWTGKVSKFFVELATTPVLVSSSSNTNLLSIRLLRDTLLVQLGDLVIHFLQTRGKQEEERKMYLQPFISILLLAKNLDDENNKFNRDEDDNSDDLDHRQMKKRTTTAQVRINTVLQLERIVNRCLAYQHHQKHQHQHHKDHHQHEKEKEKEDDDDVSSWQTCWEVILRGLSLTAQFEPDVVEACWPIVRSIVEKCENDNNNNNHYYSTHNDDSSSKNPSPISRFRIQTASSFAASQSSPSIAKASILFTEKLAGSKLENNTEKQNVPVARHQNEHHQHLHNNNRKQLSLSAVSSLLSVILSPSTECQVKVAALLSSTRILLLHLHLHSSSSSTHDENIIKLSIFDGFLIPLFSSKSFFAITDNNSGKQNNTIVAAVASAVALIKSSIGVDQVNTSSIRNTIDFISLQLNKCYSSSSSSAWSANSESLVFPTLLVWFVDQMLKMMVTKTKEEKEEKEKENDDESSLRSVSTWSLSSIAGNSLSSDLQDLLQLALTPSSSSSKLTDDHFRCAINMMMNKSTILTMLSDAQVVGAGTLTPLREAFGDDSGTVKTITMVDDNIAEPCSSKSTSDFVMVNDDADDEQESKSSSPSLQIVSIENIEVLLASFATAGQFCRCSSSNNTKDDLNNNNSDVLQSMFSIVDSWMTRSKRSLNFIETGVAVRLALMLLESCQQTSSTTTHQQQQQKQQRGKFGIAIMKWIYSLSTELDSHTVAVDNNDDSTSNSTEHHDHSPLNERRLSKAMLLLIPLTSKLLQLGTNQDHHDDANDDHDSKDFFGFQHLRHQKGDKSKNTSSSENNNIKEENIHLTEFVDQVLKLVPLLPSFTKATKLLLDYTQNHNNDNHDDGDCDDDYHEMEEDDHDNYDDDSNDHKKKQEKDPGLMLVWRQFHFSPLVSSSSISCCDRLGQKTKTKKKKSPFDVDELALDVSKFLTEFSHMLQ